MQYYVMYYNVYDIKFKIKSVFLSPSTIQNHF